MATRRGGEHPAGSRASVKAAQNHHIEPEDDVGGFTITLLLFFHATRASLTSKIDRRDKIEVESSVL